MQKTKAAVPGRFGKNHGQYFFWFSPVCAHLAVQYSPSLQPGSCRGFFCKSDKRGKKPSSYIKIMVNYIQAHTQKTKPAHKLKAWIRALPHVLYVLQAIVFIINMAQTLSLPPQCFDLDHLIRSKKSSSYYCKEERFMYCVVVFFNKKL